MSQRFYGKWFCVALVAGSASIGYSQAAAPPPPANQTAAAPATTPTPKPREKKEGSPAKNGVSYVNPPSMAEVDTYSKAAVLPAAAGKTIYFSGSIPLDKAFNVIGKGDLRLQVRQCLKNLEIVMKATNVTKEDIVKLTVQVVYKGNSDSFIVAEELMNYFDREEMPATTMSGSPFIVAEGILVQIEAIGFLKQ